MHEMVKYSKLLELYAIVTNIYGNNLIDLQLANQLDLHSKQFSACSIITGIQNVLPLPTALPRCSICSQSIL